MNIVILGAMWGDEGKGHITHHLSKDFDWIVRFNGGANAGHTIYRDGIKYVHNLMPSFDWRSKRPKAFLGSGMVIDLPQLSLEVSNLFEIDATLPSRIYVDPDAFVVLESHKEEDKKLNGHIGSTNRGIGPAYKSKIERKGIRIRDFLNKNSNIDDSWAALALDKLQKMGVNFLSSLEILPKMTGTSVLFEGAQGVLLDINHGIYPYVSCSDATIGGIIASGFASIKIDKVYGVAKCYTTKVGEGPFPSELHGEAAEALRKLGNEYGATTGRPRRVGWLDLPALKYACIKGGITNLILTKFDILDGLSKIPVCTSYDKMPQSSSDFFTAKMHLTEVDGWNNSKNIDQIIHFVKMVENYTKCKIDMVSCGISESDIFEL